MLLAGRKYYAVPIAIPRQRGQEMVVLEHPPRIERAGKELRAIRDRDRRGYLRRRPKKAAPGHLRAVVGEREVIEDAVRIEDRRQPIEMSSVRRRVGGEGPLFVASKRAISVRDPRRHVDLFVVEVLAVMNSTALAERFAVVTREEYDPR